MHNMCTVFPDGTWRVMEAGPPPVVVQEGATPQWTAILEVSMATGKTGKDELRSEGDPGMDGRLPPSWIKVVFVLVLTVSESICICRHSKNF